VSYIWDFDQVLIETLKDQKERGKNPEQSWEILKDPERSCRNCVRWSWASIQLLVISLMATSPQMAIDWKDLCEIPEDSRKSHKSHPKLYWGKSSKFGWSLVYLSCGTIPRVGLSGREKGGIPWESWKIPQLGKSCRWCVSDSTVFDFYLRDRGNPFHPPLSREWIC